MGSESIHVRVTGRLQDHIRQQTGDDAWDWLKQQLEPGLRADEEEFREISAEDVIRRNKTK